MTQDQANALVTLLNGAKIIPIHYGGGEDWDGFTFNTAKYMVTWNISLCEEDRGDWGIYWENPTITEPGKWVSFPYKNVGWA